ncbi:outer membrane protein assembly factor BamB [Nitrosovibrio sp. Nv6]|uniref:outer membrane protein assembly factor BamB n=1 Tax=Nitrosovibrio sp. Nv6 TaxID=1855340 RepID=UPI0008C98F4A|nr:outer membrane protein assembly factor BamB [Nitrosovibrio sp. Nv6]SEP41930.1 outer membrane protein assembly factor BamB [Nitrosovibrio sp. Nv6]
MHWNTPRATRRAGHSDLLRPEWLKWSLSAIIFLSNLLHVNWNMPAGKPASPTKFFLPRETAVPCAKSHGGSTQGIHGNAGAGAMWRHALLLASSLILSGCVGMVDMVRDVARDLADIDVSGITEMFGGGGVELTPDQIAQLGVIPQARLLWQNKVEEGQAAVFVPVLGADAVYAAGMDGRLVRFDPASGKEFGIIDTKHRLSGGIGRGEGMLLVGTFRGEVLAFDEKTGNPLWTALVSSEVLSPPQAANGMVVVRSGDGRIFCLDAKDGKRKWIYQGATPSLTVRSFAGVLIADDKVYAGFPGGKLVAINMSNGNAAWEAAVARPRGPTELERLADITSLPVMDEQQVCTVAYQGRVACFEIATGNQIWAREVSSNAGLAMDKNYLYVSADRGAILAYDKKDGSSIWTQELLNGLRLSPPLIQDARIVVGDSQGYVNIIRNDNGAIIARSPTDESAIVTRPVPLPSGFAVVQTRKGGVYAFSM